METENKEAIEQIEQEIVKAKEDPNKEDIFIIKKRFPRLIFTANKPKKTSMLILPANPSRPSIQLMALATPDIHKKVIIKLKTLSKAQFKSEFIQDVIKKLQHEPHIANS